MRKGSSYTRDSESPRNPKDGERGGEVDPMSRKHNTANETVLRTLEEQVHAHAISKWRIEAKDGDSRGFWASMQHRGVETNWIDFTEDPWIALYFAARGGEGEEGRIWKMSNGDEERQKIRVRDKIDEIGRARAEQQQSVLVQSKNGKIEKEELQEVTRVSGELKGEALEILAAEANITEDNLFPDAEAWINSKKEEERTKIPFKAAIMHWMEMISRGETAGVIREAERVLAEGNDYTGHVVGAGYCKGLALAREGCILEAEVELQNVVEEFKGRKLPRALRRNMQVLRTAKRRRKPGYVKKRSNTETFPELWGLHLEGYRLTRVVPVNEVGDVKVVTAEGYDKVSLFASDVSLEE